MSAILHGISENVYFQPPETVKMKYPCIVYELETVNTNFADNILYLYKDRYKVTVIDKDPDSEIADEISKLQYCVFDRHFTLDNLNHFVYLIYH